MSFITAIGTAVPPNRLEQSSIRDFMVKAMGLGADDSRKLNVVFRSSGIETRHSVLPDYGKTTDFNFYSNHQNFEPVPSTEKRIEAYRQHAAPLSIRAIKNCFAEREDFHARSVTHILVVSCTGMYAPGLDIDLVHQLGLPLNVQRTCINFMGCYAAFNALKIADAFCRADESSRVLIVCTELCSLHFQREPSDDNILANALFADGAAAVLVEGKKTNGINLSLEIFHNGIAPNAMDDMAWSIGNLGFEMKLSSYVPDVIRFGIRELTDRLLEKVNESFDNISHFAIHPGGKKILEVIENELGFPKEKNHFAYDVLRQYGNMSSPTVLFVLQKVMHSLTQHDNGSRILSFAFGPGLTLESMLLKTEWHE